MALITSLSQDLLIEIIEDDDITQADVIALRLSCIALSKPATIVLFHRIRISQLRHDRDAFLSICRSPHLAQYVRELEWQEVSWYPGYFRRIPRVPCVHHIPDLLTEPTEDDIEATCDMLDALSVDLLWLPIVPYGLPDLVDSRVEAQRREAIAQFRDEFDEVVKLLPNLRTVISRTMPPERTFDWCEYPIQTELFQTHNPDDLTAVPPHSNDGLFLFLLPAMERSALHITRLLWEDGSPGASYLRPSCPEAFRRLDTMSISLIPMKGQRYDNLTTNLEAATSVRNLSLGLEYVQNERGPEHLQLTLLRFSLEDKCTRWSQLHSLSLVSMPLVRSALVGIVRPNAETLSHLYLCDCQLDLSVMKRLSEIPALRLKSLRVVEHDYPQQLIAEDELLCFINKEPTSRYPNTPFATLETLKVTFATTTSDGVRQYGSGDDDEQQSVYSDADSEDSHDVRLRTAPKWTWGRYFHEDRDGQVFYFQVPDSQPGGHPTINWKFTSRDGQVGIGSHPLEFFDDWDPEAGDIEEPVPYCTDLYEFLNERVVSGGVLERFLGPTVAKTLFQLRPPEGAIKYDEREAESAEAYED
ncbi:hypothetical protein B0T10DRAFT_520153 [Thelonectria olida]|uniref:F-box domain-containing protein n=1 Tax=Thelonectria olida TaxID=1576542 RepID=A0A9P8VX41_9HYPO|nr:hypothetical protein B0T10DRAFT_520153 [Thelonectria olida]